MASIMKKLFLALLLLGVAVLEKDASAQVYSAGSGGPAMFAALPGNTCTLGQSGVSDLTNTCNDIYLLTGVIK